ncbi:No apical meristem (NAM) protein [Corchorus olitorius]|uniref:No apical meristem (NAM) protein n=1 Tax=Corchorus olitorius TaxID=93759 RepID=A0A1R3KXV7_9ROSI|nr:No apical meristem (NAM) protein [Corchorus olitorius]
MSSVVNVPPGFRFTPAAEEIFNYYLCPAMKGEAFPLGILRECDVYEREPWHLFEKDPSQSFWVLTPLKRLSENKIQRTAGSGVWNGRGTIKKALKDTILAVCEIKYKPKPSNPSPQISNLNGDDCKLNGEILSFSVSVDDPTPNPLKKPRLDQNSVDDPNPNPLKKPRLDQTIAALLASNGPKSNLLPNFLNSNLLPNFLMSKLLLATLVLMITFMLLAPTNSNTNLRLQNFLSQLRRSLIGMSFQLLKQCQWITLMNAISFHLDLTIWWKTKAMHFRPSSTIPSTMS